MARLKSLELGHLESVARQVGGLLGASVDDIGSTTMSFGSGGAALEVVESFPLVALSQGDAEAALKSRSDFSTAVRPTGIWHHQVRGSNNYVGFARAEFGGHSAAATPQVLEYASSSEAAVLDRAIQLIDREGVPDDFEAYLLDSAELGAAAVLLVDSTQKKNSLAVVVRKPRTAPVDLGSADNLRISPSTEFLRWYASLREIRGVQFPREDFSTRGAT